MNKNILTIAISFLSLLAIAQNNNYSFFYKPHNSGATVGLKDKNGNIIIPANYQSVDSVFYNGLSIVTITSPNGGGESYYGFVNQSGEEVIAPKKNKYTEAQLFSEGLAEVVCNNKTGFIDMKGNVIIPLKYQKIITHGSIAHNEGFYEGLARVELGNKYGFIDKTGKEVIAMQYDNVTDFMHGVSVVTLNGKHGVIDRNGKVIVPIEFADITQFKAGTLAVKSVLPQVDVTKPVKYKWDMFDTLGNQVHVCSDPDHTQLNDEWFGISLCLENKYVVTPRTYDDRIKKSDIEIETAPELDNRGLVLLIPIYEQDTLDNCVKFENSVLSLNLLSGSAEFSNEYRNPPDANGNITVIRTYKATSGGTQFIFTFDYLLRANGNLPRLCFFYFGTPTYSMGSGLSVDAMIRSCKVY